MNRLSKTDAILGFSKNCKQTLRALIRALNTMEQTPSFDLYFKLEKTIAEIDFSLLEWRDHLIADKLKEKDHE